MRLPAAAHLDRPWRIHEIAPDFEVEDVWELSTPGAGPDDLAGFLDGLVAPQDDDLPLVVRFLIGVRWKLGALLRWDRDDDGLGARVRSLAERLPADLRDTDTGREDSTFTPLYLTDREYAAEIANRTVHGVLHLGWVPDADGPGYHPQLAVLVKPNRAFGTAYMAAIKPFRYLLVYPPMLRSWERKWRERVAA